MKLLHNCVLHRHTLRIEQAVHECGQYVSHVKTLCRGRLSASRPTTRCWADATFLSMEYRPSFKVRNGPMCLNFISRHYFVYSEHPSSVFTELFATNLQTGTNCMILQLAQKAKVEFCSVSSSFPAKITMRASKAISN